MTSTSDAAAASASTLLSTSDAPVDFRRVRPVAASPQGSSLAARERRAAGQIATISLSERWRESRLVQQGKLGA
jgi:hypothetical protein